MKNFNKIIALTLLLILSVSIIPNNVYAQGNYEDLITSVTNPSNGIISFTVTISKGTEIHYNVYAKTKNYNGSCDSQTGVIKNTTTGTISKTINVPVNAFGTYEVHAITYSLNSNISLGGWDIDSCISKFTGTIYAEKFSWTQDEINKYNNGQSISKAIEFGYFTFMTGISTFAKATPVGAAISITFEIIDILISGKAPSTVEVATTPYLGNTYQYKFVANSSGTGYYTYIIITSPITGINTVYIETTSSSEITRIR